MNDHIIFKRVKSISEKCITPSGYTGIPVLSWRVRDTKYYHLSPYYLRTDGDEECVNPGNVVFENFWQGLKVYSRIYEYTAYSHWSRKTNPLWKWGQEAECLDVNGNILPIYWEWRKSLWRCENAIRYPVGMSRRHTCKFAVLKHRDGSEERLDYLTSRKRIYNQEYKRLVKKLDIYDEIVDMLCDGKKLCIFEIDVPAIGKRGLYGKCDMDGIFRASPEKIKALLNDSSEPFGHGLALADALFEDVELQT